MPGLSRDVMEYRQARMRRLMSDHGYDALALSGPDWVEWAANHHVFEAAWERPFLFVVTADNRSKVFLSELSRPAIAAAVAGGQLWVDDVIFYGDSPYAVRRTPWLSAQWEEMVAETLGAAGLGTARIGFDSMPEPLAKAGRLLPGATFVPAGAALREMRWVKHPEEIATMQAVADLSDWAMALYREELWPGRLAAEADFAVSAKLTAEVARRMPDAAFMTTSVFTLSGPVSAHIHGANARIDRRVEDNAVAISQISARLNGVQMELTRPWIVGSPKPEIMAYVDCVLEAQEASIAAAMPGRPVSGLQTAAQAVVDRAGHGVHFQLRASHGIGVIMHDFPENLPFEDRPLLEGEAYAIEPGLNIEGVGGFRFADVIVVSADGPRRITRSTKEIAQLTLGGAKGTAKASEPVRV